MHTVLLGHVGSRWCRSPMAPEQEPAGSGAPGRDPSQCTCGTRPMWLPQCTAARRAPASASAGCLATSRITHHASCPHHGSCSKMMLDMHNILEGREIIKIFCYEQASSKGHILLCFASSASMLNGDIIVWGVAISRKEGEAHQHPSNPQRLPHRQRCGSHR